MATPSIQPFFQRDAFRHWCVTAVTLVSVVALFVFLPMLGLEAAGNAIAAELRSVGTKDKPTAPAVVPARARPEMPVASTSTRSRDERSDR